MFFLFNFFFLCLGNCNGYCFVGECFVRNCCPSIREIKGVLKTLSENLGIRFNCFRTGRGSTTYFFYNKKSLHILGGI